jgi:hypothetical protein
MESFVAGELRIEPEPDGKPDAIRLHWLGKSTALHPEALIGPYLTAALDTAAGERRRVEMHFEKLGFFNSSTVTAIIQTIQAARTRGVALTLVFDPAIRAQKTSFEALRGLVAGDGLVALKPV